MDSQKTNYTYIDSHQSLMKTDSSETDSSDISTKSGKRIINRESYFYEALKYGYVTHRDIWKRPVTKNMSDL